MWIDLGNEATRKKIKSKCDHTLVTSWRKKTSPSFDNTFLSLCACHGLMSMYFLLMSFLICWMTFKNATSSFVDTFTFNCVTSSFIDSPIFKHVTSFCIHALTFKHLLSSTSSFKHWTSPFKETLMALRQTKKTKHRNNYALLPFQTLKTLKHVISSCCQTMHMSKKTRGETWNCTKIGAFSNLEVSKWPRYYKNEDQLRPNLPGKICQADPVL